MARRVNREEQGVEVSAVASKGANESSNGNASESVVGYVVLNEALFYMGCECAQCVGERACVVINENTSYNISILYVDDGLGCFVSEGRVVVMPVEGDELAQVVYELLGWLAE